MRVSLCGNRRPSHVLGQGLVNGVGDQREVDRDVVLKTVVADMSQQLLQIRDFDHAIAANVLSGSSVSLPWPRYANILPLRSSVETRQ